MAIYGVLGDIHGNFEALVSTLDALRKRGVAQLLCVGDIIGYNADSDECVSIMRAQDAQIVAGNHDLIGTGMLGFDRCSNKARYSLQQTRRRLKEDSANWLKRLPRTLLIEPGIALIHGGVRDVQLYMTTTAHIRHNAALLHADMPGTRVCFFGHSHEQKVYEVSEDSVTEQDLPRPAMALSRGRVYFINAGSVDAQRKCDYNHNLAQCAIFDSERWTVEFICVPYEAAVTESKAAENGYRIRPLTDRWYTLRRRLLRGWKRFSMSRPSAAPPSD